MYNQIIIRFIVVGCIMAGLSSCASLEEARTTGDQFVLYSQRLNTELQAFEKSLESNRKTRGARIDDWDRKAQAYEEYVTATSRVWSVSQDKNAEHLFKSVRTSRPAPLDLTFSLAPNSKEKGTKEKKKQKLYDPKSIETTIKRVQDLTREESFRDRVEFAFGFAKDTWSQVKGKQNEAKEEVDNAAKEANKIVPDIKKLIDSSVK